MSRHRRPPTLRETLERALNRASYTFVLVMVLLIAWHCWPTDGTPPAISTWTHFHLRF